jgi:hypothetical protein
MAAQHRLPFLFRIYSQDGNGIIYKAVRQVGDDAYDCLGSRPIGTTRTGHTIWLLEDLGKGGYTDVMPTGSMHEILRPADVHKLSKEEKLQIIERGNLDKKYKDYDCFYDETSYWFMRKKSRSKSKSARSRSSSRSGSNSNSKSKKSKGKKASNGKASNGKASNRKASNEKASNEKASDDTASGGVAM